MPDKTKLVKSWSLTLSARLSIQGERMAVFLKMDGKCVGCALGVVQASIPEDVQMQICIDYPLRP